MMLKEWFSAQECADLLGMSKAGFIKMAARKEYRTRPRQGRGGGLEYHLSSLPLPAQEALMRAESREILAAAPPIPSNSRELQPVQDDAALIAARKAEGDAKAAQLRGAAQARMDAKREILAVVEAAKRAGSNVETAVVDYNAGRLAASPATRALIPEVSVSTVHRWGWRIHGYGLASLAGRYGNRAGSGIIDRHPQLAAALRAFLLDYPHAQPARAHEWLRARYDLDWDALPADIAGDGPIPMPSLKTVARWIDRWKQENAELYACLSNPDHWKNKYMIGWGDASAHILRLNQVWEFDSTPADVMLKDGRHSIIGVIDLYSRRAKLHVSKTSRAAAVAHLLKNALLDWGVPEIAKTDNGQDYVSHHIGRILQALDIEQQISAPFCPWQKPHIERFFRSFSHDLLELMPGYLGHNVADREALRAREQFSDRLFVKNRPVELLHLDAPALQDFCDRWTAAYHARPHRGLKGKTPLERVAAWREPVRALPDPRVLDLLLLEAPGNDGWRTVTKSYGVRVDSFEYMTPELGLHVGQRVRVLYDPEAADLIYCFDAKGGFIATAECPELTGTSRQALTAAAKAVQLQGMRDRKREARREARGISTRDALEVILAAREQAAPVVFPPAADPETYTTAHLDGAAAALRGDSALGVGTGFTPEQAKALGYLDPPTPEDAPPPPPPPPAIPTAYANWFEGMRDVIHRTLGDGEPLSDADAAYVAAFYEDHPNPRTFEAQMNADYGAARFHAWKRAAIDRAHAPRDAAPIAHQRTAS